ncbi:unnamed protein product [Rotaria sp. Silwood1]|nr:unnamed protein product [Rotaria sp. Silwood1]CAF3898517.1 unnamed protein product [Rotaria sp. Silwood1]CAF4014615.1 unnamed protein product [Rotaria sp. Silwood1]CAF4692661.1 unnamed protein product [Rotaria sp. Silwood1]CAF4958717.1 unnamed protein product [Rotaria sp. Silwood1]
MTSSSEPLFIKYVILEESILTIDTSDKHWLASEAFLSNEKLNVKKVDDINKFVYNPLLDLKAQKKIISF